MMKVKLSKSLFFFAVLTLGCTQAKSIKGEWKYADLKYVLSDNFEYLKLDTKLFVSIIDRQFPFELVVDGIISFEETEIIHQKNRMGLKYGKNRLSIYNKDAVYSFEYEISNDSLYLIRKTRYGEFNYIFTK